MVGAETPSGGESGVPTGGRPSMAGTSDGRPGRGVSAGSGTGGEL